MLSIHANSAAQRAWKRRVSREERAERRWRASQRREASWTWRASRKWRASRRWRSGGRRRWSLSREGERAARALRLRRGVASEAPPRTGHCSLRRGASAAAPPPPPSSSRNRRLPLLAARATSSSCATATTRSTRTLCTPGSHSRNCSTIGIYTLFALFCIVLLLCSELPIERSCTVYPIRIQM